MVGRPPPPAPPRGPQFPNRPLPPGAGMPGRGLPEPVRWIATVVAVVGASVAGVAWLGAWSSWSEVIAEGLKRSATPTFLVALACMALGFKWTGGPRWRRLNSSGLYGWRRTVMLVVGIVMAGGLVVSLALNPSNTVKSGGRYYELDSNGTRTQVSRSRYHRDAAANTLGAAGLLVLLMGGAALLLSVDPRAFDADELRRLHSVATTWRPDEPSGELGVVHRLAGEVPVPIETVLVALRGAVPIAAEPSSPTGWRVWGRIGGPGSGLAVGSRMWFVGRLEQVAPSTTRIDLEVYPSGQFARKPVRWSIVATIGWFAASCLWTACAGIDATIAFVSVPASALIGSIWTAQIAGCSRRATVWIGQTVGLPPP
jgi:hypothetical protein